MNVNPVKHKQELMKKIKPALRYGGDRPFYEWQSEAKAKLAELLGLDKMEKCDDDFTQVSVAEKDGYTEYRYYIQSEEGYYFPSVLRVPKGAAGKYPLMICLQGHSTGFHISLGEAIYPGDSDLISGGDRDFAVRAVKEGYAALAVEQRCFGECGSLPDGKPDCGHSSLIAIMNGRTTIGERVWDLSRAIDAIEAHFSELIDIDKIYLMGNSGGGTATYYAACLEERIKCAMPSCAVCSWEESITAMLHCTCNYVPHIAEYFNMGDLGGLIAPRGLVIVNGAKDGIFLKPGVDASFELAKSLYEAAGAPDMCAHVEGAEGHRFYADLAWPVFRKIAGKI